MGVGEESPIPPPPGPRAPEALGGLDMAGGSCQLWALPSWEGHSGWGGKDFRGIVGSVGAPKPQ